MLLGKVILSTLASIIALSGDSAKPAQTHRFIAVGVYMNDAIIDDNNKHIVGTWVTDVDLPAGSNTAAVQRAAQDKCAKSAPHGWRCAEMEQWDMDARGWRTAKPCAAMVLGMYAHRENGTEVSYTLWDGEAGFDTADAAIAWGRQRIRDMATMNNDRLVRTISITTNCKDSTS